MCALEVNLSSRTKFFSAQCHSSKLGLRGILPSARLSISSSHTGAFTQMAANAQSAGALTSSPPHRNDPATVGWCRAAKLMRGQSGIVGNFMSHFQQTDVSLDR